MPHPAPPTDNRQSATAVPPDDAAAHAQSTRLLALIADEMKAHGGWMSFARYMELCLYAPGLGYYSGPARKLGSGPQDASDFVTAPEMSPLFGRCVARQLAEICAASAPHILEFGAGSGALAAHMLAELERLDALPERYAILDLSADLRARQRATLEAQVPHLLPRVIWLDALPERIEGAVVANEVLDAMPVDVVVAAGDRWLERGVALDTAGQLSFADRDIDADSKLSDAALHHLGPAENFSPGYVTEIGRAACGFVTSVAERLAGQAGALLFVDYGFPARELYHPQRTGGTLMAHLRHRAHPDVLVWPGVQDITAHVNFSAVAETARAAGLELLGYTNQAHFLINCGITDLLEGAPGSAAWLRQTNALQRLVSEAEMGELFKVMALGCGLSPALPGLSGFVRGDRGQTL